MTNRFNSSVINQMQDLYQSPGIIRRGLVGMLTPILQCAKDGINIVEWGPGSHTQFFLDSPKVKKIVSYEHDEERFHRYRNRFQQELIPDGQLDLKLAPFDVSQSGAKDVTHHDFQPTHDFLLAALKEYGENRFDLALIAGGGYQTDCAEISRLLVNDGGLIVWQGIETWYPNVFDFPSSRCLQDVLCMMPEYYYFDQHQTVIIFNHKTGGAFEGYPQIGTKYHLLKKTYESLHNAGILFVTLRNFDEIPLACSMQNDIDLLIHPNHFTRAETVFRELEYIQHRDNGSGASYLYSAKPHDHFHFPSRDLHIDVVQGLYYTSPHGGEKVPVHRDLQEAIFNRRRYVADLWKCLPHVNDLFMHIICHAVYDKKGVSPKYKNQLERLYPFADQSTLKRELKKIFYSCAPRLLELIESGQAEKLLTEYYQFSAY